MSEEEKTNWELTGEIDMLKKRLDRLERMILESLPYEQTINPEVR